MVLEASSIRRFLKKKGYRWLPRRQKRQYNKEERAARKAFSDAVLRLSRADLRRKLNMSMDGVVLSMPPEDDADRANYCWGGVTHMWRKPGEANTPKLAGEDKYTKQVPIGRALPLWGGLSADGFAVVHWHLDRKKVNGEDWTEEVRGGALKKALKQLNPSVAAGPWTVLCDNETFLRNKDAMKVYAAQKIRLWNVPVKSPDLNPVEMYWSWVRRKLRDMDLNDLKMKRRPLSKMAYKLRVQTVFKSKKAQDVAKACARKFRAVCVQVSKRGGAAAG